MIESLLEHVGYDIIMISWQLLVLNQLNSILQFKSNQMCDFIIKVRAHQCPNHNIIKVRAHPKPLEVRVHPLAEWILWGGVLPSKSTLQIPCKKSTLPLPGRCLTCAPPRQT